jgi:hypothetical protein
MGDESGEREGELKGGGGALREALGSRYPKRVPETWKSMDVCQ